MKKYIDNGETYYDDEQPIKKILKENEDESKEEVVYFNQYYTNSEKNNSSSASYTVSYKSWKEEIEKRGLKIINEDTDDIKVIK